MIPTPYQGWCLADEPNTTRCARAAQPLRVQHHGVRRELDHASVRAALQRARVPHTAQVLALRVVHHEPAFLSVCGTLPSLREPRLKVAPSERSRIGSAVLTQCADHEERRHRRDDAIVLCEADAVQVELARVVRLRPAGLPVNEPHPAIVMHEHTVDAADNGVSGEVERDFYLNTLGADRRFPEPPPRRVLVVQPLTPPPVPMRDNGDPSGTGEPVRVLGGRETRRELLTDPDVYLGERRIPQVLIDKPLNVLGYGLVREMAGEQELFDPLVKNAASDRRPVRCAGHPCPARNVPRQAAPKGLALTMRQPH